MPVAEEYIFLFPPLLRDGRGGGTNMSFYWIGGKMKKIGNRGKGRGKGARRKGKGGEREWKMGKKEGKKPHKKT